MLMQKLIHPMVKTATSTTNLHPTVMKLCKSYVLLSRICFMNKSTISKKWIFLGSKPWICLFTIPRMEFLDFYDLAVIATVCNKKCWKFSRRKKSMQIGEKSSENYPRPPPAVWFRSRNWSLLLLFNCAVC